jgi:hypothetical protein
LRRGLIPDDMHSNDCNAADSAEGDSSRIEWVAAASVPLPARLLCGSRGEADLPRLPPSLRHAGYLACRLGVVQLG